VHTERREGTNELGLRGVGGEGAAAAAAEGGGRRDKMKRTVAEFWIWLAFLTASAPRAGLVGSLDEDAVRGRAGRAGRAVRDAYMASERGDG
jgi:hypothetical protein